MNALDIIRKNISNDRPPRLPSRRELKAEHLRQFAAIEKHIAETGYSGKMMYEIEADGTEHWWHENAEGEMVKQ